MLIGYKFHASVSHRIDGISIILCSSVCHLPIIQTCLIPNLGCMASWFPCFVQKMCFHEANEQPWFSNARLRLRSEFYVLNNRFWKTMKRQSNKNWGRKGGKRGGRLWPEHWDKQSCALEDAGEILLIDMGRAEARINFWNSRQE